MLTDPAAKISRPFGQFIRSMRRGRTFFDSEGVLRPWTQAELARRANLSPRQIAKLEQGGVADVRRYLEPLATALALTAGEKAELYMRAGLLPPARPPAFDRAALDGLLRQFHYPASARTHLWDFVAMNAMNAALYGYTPEAIRQLNQGALGPNLLRVFFDPLFDYVRYAGGEARWRTMVVRSLRTFRAVSLSYVTNARYGQVMGEMRRYPAFDPLWEASAEPDEDGGRKPVFTVQHPRYGQMAFMSLRRPFSPGVDVLVIVPTAGCEASAGYGQMRADTPGDVLHWFDERSGD
jgi:transcriptional regulator with XRE-family HTH domain